MASVGIIGLGMIGLQHAAIVNILPDQELKAICDSESNILKLARKIVPSLKYYSDYSSMLTHEDLDTLFICTPIPTHESIVRDISKTNRGLNLFVEKPLAHSYEGALGMVEAARSLKSVTMVGFQKRFTGTYSRAKDLLSKGVVGDPLFLRAYVFSADILSKKIGWKFEKGLGGASLDYSPHLLDLLLWYLGEPSSVRSFKKSFFSQAEDLAHVDLEYKEGLRGHLDICWSMRNFNPYEMMIEIHGKNGTINVTDDRLMVYLDRDMPGVLPKGAHAFPSFAVSSSVPFLLTAPEYYLEDQYFFDCIKAQSQPDQDFEQGAKVNKFISLIREG